MRNTLALLVALFAAQAWAQAPGWRAYPAYNELSALTAAPDGIWAASDGGVFFYGVPSGELETVTSVEGLQGGRIGALAYDAARSALWIGYEDGVLERLDPETRQSTAFFEITRAEQYASRGIRRLAVSGDVLYASTDFGIVVFDLISGAVRNAYARIGDLAAGTPVNDVIEAPLPDGSPGLWAASDGGVHYARLGADNLQAPGAWTRAEGFAGAALSIALFRDDIYAGGAAAQARDLYRRRSDGVWVPQFFIDNPVTTLVPTASGLFAIDPVRAYQLNGPDGTAQVYRATGANAIAALVVTADGAAWAGDAAAGLFRLPEAGAVDFAPDTISPPGPLSTNIVDVDVSRDGVLWLVTERLESSDFATASRLEDGVWTSFKSTDPALDIAQNGFLSASVGPDGSFYAGSAGDGVTVFREGTVTTYRENNSSLLSAQGAPGFVVVRDVGFEDETAWVLNASGLPMHRFDGETWRGFPYPSGIPATAQPSRIAIDEFGQKWLALGSGGLGAWNTGADPTSGADDQAIRFTGSTQQGTGLPDPDVRDVVVDGQGRVWLGTARGVAYVFSPGSAFAGSAGLATPQWPLVADGADYLLRDVEVLDLEVDPGGQIWVGTTSGAYLINAAGDAVVRTVTAENSPLPSDEVFSVAVDPRSGRVFFVTSEGLFSVTGDATRFRSTSGDLVTAPSPYRPSADLEGVVVTGLGAPTSQVRVLTVSGDLVYQAEVRGGSFRWNGRDEQGQPVPSGVYLVAAAGSDGSTRFGKVAVVR